MHSSAINEIGKQAIYRCLRCKGIVSHSDSKNISGHSCEMRKRIRFKFTRARIRLLEPGRPKRPFVCRRRRKILMPAQRLCRKITEQRCQNRHQQMPAQPHRQSFTSFIVPPIRILCSHGHAPLNASIVFCQTDQQTADAMCHHVDGHINAVVARPLQCSIAIQSSPIQLRDLFDLAQTTSARLPDPAIVVCQCRHAVHRQELCISVIVGGLDRGCRVDNDDCPGCQCRMSPMTRCKSAAIRSDQRDRRNLHILHSIAGTVQVDRLISMKRGSWRPRSNLDSDIPSLSQTINSNVESKCIADTDFKHAVICLAVRLPRHDSAADGINRAHAITETRIIEACVSVQMFRKCIICGNAQFVDG